MIFVLHSCWTINPPVYPCLFKGKRAGVLPQASFTRTFTTWIETCTPASQTAPGEVQGSTSTLGEGLCNPGEEARGKPPCNGRNSEHPGARAKAGSCTGDYIINYMQYAGLNPLFRQIAGAMDRVNTRSKTLPVIAVTANPTKDKTEEES